MVFALILSYSLCVPMNLMYPLPCPNIILTINRYLFPLILNTTLSFPTKLALLNFNFRSLNEFQSAFSISSNHVLSDSSASGWFCQNNLNVLLEMILISSYKNNKNVTKMVTTDLIFNLIGRKTKGDRFLHLFLY
jgi:hypothetical protein